MKAIVIGGTGTLGRAVVQELERDHEVIAVGHTRGAYTVDITDDASVHALFAALGPVDAIVSTSGELHFGELATLQPAQFALGLQHKLLGQVRLALLGQHYLNEGGSITLTGGIVADEPIRGGSNATTVNTALQGFVRAAACELRGGRRINVVSPTMLSESAEQYAAFFPGFESVSAARAALAYRRSVSGIQSGRTLRVV